MVGSMDGPFCFRVVSTVPDDMVVQIHSRTEISITKATGLEPGSHTQKAPRDDSGGVMSSSSNQMEGEGPLVEEKREHVGACGSEVDSIGGMKAALKSLRELVYFSLVAPEAFQRFSIDPPRGELHSILLSVNQLTSGSFFCKDFFSKATVV